MERATGELLMVLDSHGVALLKLKRWNALLVCALVCVGLTSLSAPASKVVRAERFEVIDPEGDVQGYFGFVRRGDAYVPGWMLRSAGGEASASVVFGNGDSGGQFVVLELECDGESQEDWTVVRLVSAGDGALLGAVMNDEAHAQMSVFPGESKTELSLGAEADSQGFNDSSDPSSSRAAIISVVNSGGPKIQGTGAGEEEAFAVP